MTHTGPPTGTDEEIKAKLREEFPGWSIIRTDRGRWWATRPTLVREDLSHADGATLDADTPGKLRMQLLALTRSR